jgi:hypothetical protein
MTHSVEIRDTKYLKGRAITQVLSHQLPTVAARVQAQVMSCGICSGESSTGVGSEYFDLSCHFSFRSTLII